ncbi:MAG: gliding motility-associated C-terminal domain-containing protein, partial [Chitinophagaceae bacterium]|nr:gliding motility-associated C-terminal domain-containing protein [Chitinophagaceae bacterium]
NVWPLPVVSLDKNNELCDGSSRLLQAGNHTTFLWQDGSTGPSFNVTSTGTYYVTVGDIHQCKASDTTIISQLLPAPRAFLPEDTAVCSYGSLVILPQYVYLSYHWSNGASGQTISVTRPGEYWLNVTDAKGCIGTDSILVKGKECLLGLHVPKGFTPNNDGKNDVFLPVIGGDVVKYQLTVYNRWGQAIFTTTDRFKGWDGKYGGAQQESNVFVWVVTYQLQGDGVRSERGTVMLIR